jgi:hypothetical protein
LQAQAVFAGSFHISDLIIFMLGKKVTLAGLWVVTFLVLKIW